MCFNLVYDKVVHCKMRKKLYFFCSSLPIGQLILFVIFMLSNMYHKYIYASTQAQKKQTSL